MTAADLDLKERSDTSPAPESAAAPALDISHIVGAVEEQAHSAGSALPPPPAELAGLVGAGEASPDTGGAQALDARPACDGPVDASGTPFDPAIHAVDGNGDPKRTVAGNWAKKRGRKSANIKAPANSKFNPGAQAANPAFAGPDQAAIDKARETLETGRTMAGLTVLGAVMVGGDDFAATDKEIEKMGNSYAFYLEARGISSQMSPELVLAGALSEYLIPRLTKPKVKTRLELGLAWLKVKTGSIFRRGKAQKVQKAAEKQESETPVKNSDPYSWAG